MTNQSACTHPWGLRVWIPGGERCSQCKAERTGLGTHTERPSWFPWRSAEELAGTRVRAALLALSNPEQYGCWWCSGTGIDTAHSSECGSCNGTGYVPKLNTLSAAELLPKGP